MIRRCNVTLSEGRMCRLWLFHRKAFLGRSHHAVQVLCPDRLCGRTTTDRGAVQGHSTSRSHTLRCVGLGMAFPVSAPRHVHTDRCRQTPTTRFAWPGVSACVA
nr:hypothetical protein CFP56_55002 [Quercus suber]